MKFSVIIRFKDEERWIGHSIQSVIDIFSKDTDIVLINNKSIDNSLEIVNLFTNINTNSHKIKIIEIDNYTSGSSINKAVKYCDNENILILSSHCQIKNINFEKIKNLLNNYCAIWGKQIPIYFGKKINRNRYIVLFYKLIIDNIYRSDSINFL